ncbi:MAG TPA: hypothetical protein VFE96_07780, partial [Candidatus Bathyarchaeia archaeon]|nr:hypothetical protein [Candidatus Bathyarchaeia archaeon]
MIRGALCATFILLALTPITPLSAYQGIILPAHAINASQVVTGHDPTGTLVAFNSSRAQFELYTQQNVAAPIGNHPPSWFSNNFTNVPNTTFNVTIPSGNPDKVNVTWPLVNIPHGNFSSTTYLRFDWRGNLGNGTKASYLVYNATRATPVLNVTKFDQKTISGGPPTFTAGTPPVGCSTNDECWDASRFIGFNLTLTFLFVSNSTGKGLTVRVSNIAVASTDLTPTSSFFHSMKFDPANPTQVIHNANLTIQHYNATVHYRRPLMTTGYLNHTWTQMVVTYYYPNSYAQINIVHNGTIVSLSSPLSQGKCLASFCTNSQFIALNMTRPNNAILKLNTNITANTTNLAAKVETTLGGAPTTSWGQGDLLQIRVSLRQGVNVTGTDIVSANQTSLVRVAQTFTNIRETTSLLNFTNPLPQDPTLLGPWTVNSTFINGYDYGYNSTSFTLQQLGVTGFTYSGSNQRLTTSGTLTYAFNPGPAPNVNGYVFAIDSGSPPAPSSTTTNTTTGAGMYVSNITLVNGVFTAGQPLMMTFTLVNPTYGIPSPVGFNANLTVEHEFVSGTPHGSSATVPFPGDAPFLIQPKYVYTLNVLLTPAGIALQVNSLSTGGKVTATLPPGTPPVTSQRQQAGLFKLTAVSKPSSSSTICSTSCARGTESGVYAYVLVNAPVPGRLLASTGFTSASSGGFSAIISPASVLGASQLTFVTLGLDPNGLGITVQGQSTHESTVLQASIASIPTVTENQPTTIPLHLKSNSTTVNMNITISLNIQSSGIVTTQSGIFLAPGTSKDVTFTFTAPSTPGAYTLTFLSADYG